MCNNSNSFIIYIITYRYVFRRDKSIFLCVSRGLGIRTTFYNVLCSGVMWGGMGELPMHFIKIECIYGNEYFDTNVLVWGYRWCIRWGVL